MRKIPLKGLTQPPIKNGGTPGQLLSKASAIDGDTTWVDPPSGGGVPSYPTIVGGIDIRDTDETGGMYLDFLDFTGFRVASFNASRNFYSPGNESSSFYLDLKNPKTGSTNRVFSFDGETGIGTLLTRPVWKVGGTNRTPWDSENLVIGNYATISYVDSRTVKALNTFCSGKPAANEVIGGGIAPYTLTLVAASCKAQAVVAATTSTVFTIKKNNTNIGTVTFSAAGTVGVFSITTVAVAVDNLITIHAPAFADATLADITIQLRGT